MHITGPDYTDDDLIAPWDPARRRPHPCSRRDDPDRDDDHDESGHDNLYPPADKTNVEAES
jgi:hypothetical protein